MTKSARSKPARSPVGAQKRQNAAIAKSQAAGQRRMGLLSISSDVLRGPRMLGRLADADIFVAYASMDKPIARALVNDLRALGYRVGWDGDLRSGHRFRKQIADALARVGAVVVIWSQAAHESDFVADEAEVGQQRNRLVSTLVPGGVPSLCIPLGFRSLHWISVLATEEIEEALRDLGVTPAFGGRRPKGARGA